MNRIEHHASFGGRQEVWQHASRSTGTDMKLGSFGMAIVNRASGMAYLPL